MNRYILIRRLTGPAVLLLLGVVALLHQADLVSWSIFIPLLLILIGVLKLAQRAALAAAGDEPMYPGSPYPYGASSPPATPMQTTPTGTSLVPTQPQEFGKGPEGGRS
jgi:hypothetical protein